MRLKLLLINKNFCALILLQTQIWYDIPQPNNLIHSCYNSNELCWISYNLLFLVILLVMPNNVFEYSLIVFDFFILCNSNSILKFNMSMFLILSSPSYSSFKQSQISLDDLLVIILVKINIGKPKNKDDFSFAFFVFCSL